MEPESEEHPVSLRPISNKNGMIFALPQPILYHKNSSYHSSVDIQSTKRSKQGQLNAIHLPIAIKRSKRSKQKLKQTGLQNYKPEQYVKYEQKSVLRQTLYKKFVEKSKYYDASPESKSDRQKSINSNTNIKLRQLNLVVLSKREQLKREIKNKMEKEKGKEKETDKQKQREKNNKSMTTHSNGTSLPHFARSKSSFYKSANNQYNTLSFLSKTIFSEIQTHFTAHFPKQKAVEPLELGITKAKIMNKNETRNLKYKRKNRQSSMNKQFGCKFNNNQLIQTLIGGQWKRQKQVKARKQTEFRGWDEDLQDYSIPLYD